MALTAGTRLGSYEIVALIGAGGMGEVYRARDTKLNRDVALKVLHDVVVGDADRLARFRREAQVLASLNHPNIAHLYGFEDSPVPALVMELVEGPTLADRIAASAMPLADVLPVARQIAEALDAAHEKGIIHRDLKPANVKVRDDGTVKVLDFGLAKALSVEGAGGAAENSPTLTARATQFGVILGTAAYMAPEQARGRAVDRRADIWAFGVVLYEMLSGTRAFDGEDVSITLAGVLKEDVNWQALPADLPVPMRRLLRRCLEKDPKRRLSAIGDARLELDEALSPADRDGSMAAIASPSIPVAELPRWRRALPWTAAAAGLGLAATFLFMWAPWRPDPEPPAPRRLLAGLGADVSLPSDPGAAIVLSPDGTTMAFAGLSPSSGPRLFVRKLGELQAVAIAGTDGAHSPFFSPRGDWIGYFAGGKLKKVSATGGASVPLCDAAAGRGGTWTDDDQIVFNPAGASNVSLLRVSASGGTPVPFVGLSEGAVSQRWPQALPGGRGVLYSEHVTTGQWDNANLVIAPLSGGAPKVVVRGGYFGRYVDSGPGSPKRALREGGHLLYMQQGTLFAVPFDLDRLETVGQAVLAIDGVETLPNTGSVQLAFSSDGTVAFVPGTTQSSTNPIDWMTRDGKTSVLRATKADWVNPSFSPDGQKLALEIYDGKQRDIWVYEWAPRERMTQLTFDAAQDSGPVWTLDSRRIAFSSDRTKAGVRNLYWVNADGSGEVTRLTDSPDTQQAYSWHQSQKFLAFRQTRSGTGSDLMILPMDGDATGGWKPGQPTVFLATPATEGLPMFSPDGRWIAYASNEAGTGNFDVYVRPFKGPGGQWRINAPPQSAAYPRWSATELLFLSQAKVMFAPYSVAGESFKADTPQVWSPTGLVRFGGATGHPYDLHPDGKRLAVVAAREQAADVVRDRVVFVFNFFDHLRKIAPRQK